MITKEEIEVNINHLHNNVIAWINGNEELNLLNCSKADLEYEFEHSPCTKYSIKFIPVTESYSSVKLLIREVQLLDNKLNLVNLRRHNYVDYVEDESQFNMFDPKKRAWEKTIYLRTNGKCSSFAEQPDYITDELDRMFRECRHMVDLNLKTYGEWDTQVRTKCKQIAQAASGVLTIEGMPIAELSNIKEKLPYLFCRADFNVRDENMIYFSYSNSAKFKKTYSYGSANDRNAECHVQYSFDVNSLTLKVDKIKFSVGNYCGGFNTNEPTSISASAQSVFCAKARLNSSLYNWFDLNDESTASRFEEAKELFLKELALYNDVYVMVYNLQQKYFL